MGSGQVSLCLCLCLSICFSVCVFSLGFRRSPNLLCFGVFSSLGGTFVAKVFRGKNIQLLYSQLKVFFPLVTVSKPRSSRNASIEAFVVCEKYSPPRGFQPEMLRQILEEKITVEDLRKRTGSEDEDKEAKRIVPFVACGDLQGWDSEKSYAHQTQAVFMSTGREEEREGEREGEGEGEGGEAAAAAVSLAPVQPPIAPPYKRALELIKHNANQQKATFTKLKT